MSLLCSNIDGSSFFTAYTLLYMTATSCTTSSFVYLKSFKELFPFSWLPFVVESVCKVRSFFRNRQTFSKVFSKSFFWRRKLTSSGCRSRSLNAVKVRYLDRRRTVLPAPFPFRLSSLQRLSLSKAGAKLRTFSLSPTFTHTFFQNFCKKIHKWLCFRYILRQILRKEEKEAGRGTQYTITRVQARARLDRTEKSRKGENSCRMERKIPLEGWNSLSDDTKKNPEILPEEGKKCSFGRKIHAGK